MDLRKEEQTALEAVAKRFSATWEKGNDRADAYLVVAGKQVAVEITTLKSRGPQGDAAKPGLRFDKVATRLIERLQGTVEETVADGMTVLMTISAPIHLPSKTAAALEDKIQAFVGRYLPGRDVKDTMNGNRVRIRFLRDAPKRASKMIAFVHNSDSDPLPLLDMSCESLELTSTEAARRARKPAGDRWILVISRAGIAYLEAYRYIYSRLRMAAGVTKVLMMFGDGRVEVLKG